MKRGNPTGIRQFNIQAAIDAASPGGTVVVPAGVYSEQLVILKPLILTGPEPEDGVAVIDTAGMAAVSTIRIYADDVTVQLLTLQNGPSFGIQGGGTGFDNLTDIVIRANTIRNHDLAGVVTANVAAMRIENNTIENNGLGAGFNRNGLVLITHGACQVVGNTIRNNAVDGIFARGSTAGLWIENNIIDGHSNSGITIARDEKNVTIKNNQITNNGLGATEETGGIVIFQAMVEEISGNTIVNNNLSGIFWGNTPTTGPAPPQILIRNNHIAGSSRDAIYLFSMGPGGWVPPDPFPLTPVVTNNNLQNSGRAGVYVSNAYLYSPGHANPAVHNNGIAGNDWGVFNATAGIVDATGNWWGADSGPLHATGNPGGEGDPVSDRVLFDPWLGEPPLECVDPNGDCALSCTVFTESELRGKFGYRVKSAACGCYDVCVKNVRAVSAKQIRHEIAVPGISHLIGCRGGRGVIGTPVLQRCRVYAVQGGLQLTGRGACLAVRNLIGLECTLKVDAPKQPVYLVVRDIITRNHTFEDFFAFPSGDAFTEGEFRDLIKFIDGSAKTLIIENCAILNTDNPRIEVTLKLIDKLWKHENLLVSALRPYAENMTVTGKFNGTHKIGPFPGSNH